MIESKVFAIILLWACCIDINAKDLKVVFWIEPVQKDISNDIANGIKEIKDLKLDIQIHDSTIIVKDEETNEEPDPMTTFCEILALDGASIVIDFTYQPWHAGIDLLNIHQIPIIRVHRTISPFLEMFGQFLQEKGGNDVVLIFQNEQDKTEALYHMVEGFSFRTMLVNAFDEKDFVKRLRDLRPSPAYFAIFARTNNMNVIFEKITKGKLFARPEEWHFIYLDTRDDTFKYKTQAANATKFVVDSKAVCRLMDMSDAYCSSEFTFQRAMIFDIFRSLDKLSKSLSNSLPIIQATCNETTDENRETASELIGQLQLSNFMTFSSINDFDELDEQQPILTYSMNVTISTYSNEAGVATDLAVWKTGEILKINQTISSAKRFFRVGTTEAPPWSYYVRDKHTNEIILDENGKAIWEGYCIDFVDTLAEKLNFDYELVSPSKGKFGERNVHTGQWDGIVGDLVTGETDFAVTALKMYSEREEVIDFIAPYFEQTGISIVMRKPVRQTSLFKFMTVLRLEVWLCIVAALVATAVLIWLLDKYSPYSSRNNPEAYPYPCREFTLRESFWFALTSFTPQGGGEAPKAVSGRILVAAYWLFVVLMLATFTANLAAFLTVERMQTPVQNLEQLARQSRINYTVVAESDTHQYFINMKFAEDTLYRMWKELALNASSDFHKYRIWDYPIKEQYGHILLAINASEPVRDAAEGFKKVNEHENADFAFIHDSSEIKYELTRNCNLTEVGEVFAEQPYAIAVQQGSHLADEFSYAILELQKDRYFEELKGKYWNQTLLKQCTASEDQEGITLESLGGVFIATLFGLGLSMITLAVEVFYYKKRHPEIAAVKQPHKVTKVKPFDENADPQDNVRINTAWHTDQDTLVAKITPPPSFESATYFRGRKVPNSITLGGREFKPRRLGKNSEADGSQISAGTSNYGYTYSQKDNLPPYME